MIFIKFMFQHKKVIINTQLKLLLFLSIATSIQSSDKSTSQSRVVEVQRHRKELALEHANAFNPLMNSSRLDLVTPMAEQNLRMLKYFLLQRLDKPSDDKTSMVQLKKFLQAAQQKVDVDDDSSSIEYISRRYVCRQVQNQKRTPKLLQGFYGCIQDVDAEIDKDKEPTNFVRQYCTTASFQCNTKIQKRMLPSQNSQRRDCSSPIIDEKSAYAYDAWILAWMKLNPKIWEKLEAQKGRSGLYVIVANLMQHPTLHYMRKCDRTYGQITSSTQTEIKEMQQQVNVVPSVPPKKEKTDCSNCGR